MKTLTNPADIYDQQDRAELFEDVPEWGFRLRFMTPTLDRIIEFHRLMRALDSESGKGLLERAVQLIAFTAVGEDGEPLFVEDAALEALRKRNHEILSRLAGTARRVIGGAQEEVEKAEGESEGTQDSDSGST